MTIMKPEQEDLQAAFEFIGMMTAVARHELNPLEKDEFDELRFLEDKDKAKVLDALCEKFNNCDLDWLLIALAHLLFPDRGVIDQNSEILTINQNLLGDIDKSC